MKTAIAIVLMASLSGCATAVIDYQLSGSGDELPELVIMAGDSVVRINNHKEEVKWYSEKNIIGVGNR